MLDHVESEEDFQIDRYKLEEEAEKQADLLRHYAKKLSIWSAKKKELKRQLEHRHSICAETIRNNPKAYDLQKTTDTVVYGLALGEPDYIEMHKEYVFAQQQESLYEGYVKALLQKGSMIKELVSLWLNNYYSNPIVKKEEKTHRVKLKVGKPFDRGPIAADTDDI